MITSLVTTVPVMRVTPAPIVVLNDPMLASGLTIVFAPTDDRPAEALLRILWPLSQPWLARLQEGRPYCVTDVAKI